jgi:nucleotide-binding universal stress UspA family protein
MFTKILVANDGSDGARRAVEVACDLAARYDAELHSITIEEDLPRYAATLDEVDAAKERRDRYFEQLQREEQAIAAAVGVALQPHVIGGFDLLVLGFMGHSRIFERVWGSTSQTLTRLAPCTVIIAK